MAKKNIITDFNSLKGKLTFSENCRVLEADAQRGAASHHRPGHSSCHVEGGRKSVPQHGPVDKSRVQVLTEEPVDKTRVTVLKEEPVDKSRMTVLNEESVDERVGRVLKVGQKVVMMDSDLRGKIVSLGKTVSIELEDGFVIQAAYGEFAVTCDTEVSALKQSKVKGHHAGRFGQNSGGGNAGGHKAYGLSGGSNTGGQKAYGLSGRSNAGGQRASGLSGGGDTGGQRASGRGARGVIFVDLHIEAIPGGRNVPNGQQLQFQLETFRRVLNENLPHRGLRIEFVHGHGDGILKAAIRKELDEVYALRCSYSIGDPAVTVVSIR